MTVSIPEEAFYDELRAATTFNDYVSLFRAVLFDYEASPENDKRQDQLVFAVQRAGLSMDRVMREARKRTTNEQGVVGYELEDVQQMEVLVDGLDDPKTRWVVADLLLTHWFGWPLRVPTFIHERVLGFLGVPVGSEESLKPNQATRALHLAAQYPEQLVRGRLNQPLQVWACRTLKFTDREWAQAYADIMEAWDARKGEE